MEDKTIRKNSKQAEKGESVWSIEDLDMITKLSQGDLNLEYTNFDIVELIQNIIRFARNESW
jgi:two-component system phosphate regulon sensor histidine kinase PhoR